MAGTASRRPSRRWASASLAGGIRDPSTVESPAPREPQTPQAHGGRLSTARCPALASAGALAQGGSGATGSASGGEVRRVQGLRSWHVRSAAASRWPPGRPQDGRLGLFGIAAAMDPGGPLDGGCARRRSRSVAVRGNARRGPGARGTFGRAARAHPRARHLTPGRQRFRALHANPKACGGALWRSSEAGSAPRQGHRHRRPTAASGSSRHVLHGDRGESQACDADPAATDDSGRRIDLDRREPEGARCHGRSLGRQGVGRRNAERG